MNNIILKDTSLAAIVMDEMMNPARGIADFVESTVPYVEQAVIVDTGSLDGIRKKLEAEYSNLSGMQRKFIDWYDQMYNGRNKKSSFRNNFFSQMERI